MKNLIFLLAFACFSLVSCQKETLNVEERTTIRTENWLLYDATWSVDFTNSTPQTFTATSPFGPITATETILMQLPTSILTILHTEGVRLNTVTSVWKTDSSQYFLTIQTGTEVLVYWFDSPSHIKSIGHTII